METLASDIDPGMYDHLVPLDNAREMYLSELVTRLGSDRQGHGRWDAGFDRKCRDYATQTGTALNKTLELAGAVSPEEIEDVIVGHVVFETRLRWFTYSHLVGAADKEAILIEAVGDIPSITLDIVRKSDQVRASWRTFAESYGFDAIEKPHARAEFVRNKMVWDTAKEELFLREILASTPSEAIQESA